MSKLVAVAMVIVLACTGCSALVRRVEPPQGCSGECDVVWEPSSVAGAVVLIVGTTLAVGVAASSTMWNDGRSGRTAPADGVR